jgi:hypothetical protein
MANLLKWNAYATGVALADNTAMASRADGYFNIAQVTAADVVIDNSTNLNMLMDIQILLGSAVWVASGWLELYTLLSTDGGTTYDSGSSTFLPGPQFMEPPIQISPGAVTQAVSLTARGIILRPGKTKILWRTKAGVTTASTGNSMTYYVYTPNLNG